MIVYFDTSAIVPLLVEEPGSAVVADLWTEATTRVSARLVHVEAAAALASAERRGRLTSRQRRTALASLDSVLERLDVVEITPALTTQAAALAVAEGLRGYDAVHCAAALAVSSPRVVAASGDQHLLAAWLRRGLATADTSRPARPPS